jgi:chemotaxis protein methyltransferase CheR
MGLRWPGFRRVRGQVCKRLGRRIAELGLADTLAYRRHLEGNAAEWNTLAALCTVTISRFYRDREIFDHLGSTVLPALAQAACARGARRLECWSAGCARGEEPYTLALQWRLGLARRFAGLRLRVLATDVDSALLERARTACYGPSSLAELPAAWRKEAFDPRGGMLCLRDAFRTGVEFERQDVAAEVPRRTFDMVLCRNLAFTYFGAERARQTLEHIASRLRTGGALVIGVHERLPAPCAVFEPWPGCRATFRRIRGRARPAARAPRDSRRA